MAMFLAGPVTLRLPARLTRVPLPRGSACWAQSQHHLLQEAPLACLPGLTTPSEPLPVTSGPLQLPFCLLLQTVVPFLGSTLNCNLQDGSSV